jgi:uncharacterized repeat protein (TIGR02543 family)
MGIDYTRDNLYIKLPGYPAPVARKRLVANGKLVWAVMTVFFDENGGNGVSDKTVYYKRAYGTLPSTSKTGYTFDGWFTAEDWATEITAATIVSQSFNHTLYAKHDINYYTVTWKDWNGTQLKSESVAYGGNGTPPADPTRTGYTFSSWSGDYTGITGNVTITATYTVRSYTLTINSITGISSQTVTRTSSPSGAGSAPQVLSNGATIYYGDVLTISANASSGYSASVSGSPVTISSSISTSSYISVGYVLGQPTASYFSSTQTSISFKVTNANSQYSVRIYYKIGGSPTTSSYDGYVDVAASGTSVTQTINSLTEDTSYTVYYRAYKSGYYSTSGSTSYSTQAGAASNWVYRYTSQSNGAYNYDGAVIKPADPFSCVSTTVIDTWLTSNYPPSNYSSGYMMRVTTSTSMGGLCGYYWFEAV